MLEPGKDFQFYNPNGELEIHHQHLPHWRQSGVLYFVTFRQSDSIPKDKLDLWKEQYRLWLLDHPKPWPLEVEEEYRERFARQIEVWLDQGFGSCDLLQDSCRQVVEQSLQFFCGTRYWLDECVVAANHVHALLVPLEGHDLSKILQSLKSYTGRQINHLTGKTGSFWQKESYDHIVRSPESLTRIRSYIKKHNVGATSRSHSQSANGDLEIADTFDS